MSDAPERIWAWPFNDWYRGGCSTAKVVVAGAKDVEYIRADLARAAPTVKPLDWVDFDRESIAKGGQYRVYLLDDGVVGRKTFRAVFASFGGQYIADFRDNSEPENAREKAKGACEDHHRNRILSALK